MRKRTTDRHGLTGIALRSRSVSIPTEIDGAKKENGTQNDADTRGSSLGEDDRIGVPQGRLEVVDRVRRVADDGGAAGEEALAREEVLGLLVLARAPRALDELEGLLEVAPVHGELGPVEEDVAERARVPE